MAAWAIPPATNHLEPLAEKWRVRLVGAEVDGMTTGSC
jgi:hypothetical protein